MFKHFPVPHLSEKDTQIKDFVLNLSGKTECQHFSMGFKMEEVEDGNSFLKRFWIMFEALTTKPFVDFWFWRFIFCGY